MNIYTERERERASLAATLMRLESKLRWSFLATTIARSSAPIRSSSRWCATYSNNNNNNNNNKKKKKKTNN